MHVFRVDEEGPPLRSGADMIEIVYAAPPGDDVLLAIPVARLDASFFDLKSGVAGDIAQKLVNYRVRAAIVGDVSAYVAASPALRDFVRESNRGAHIWFVASLAELAARLDDAG